LNFIFLTILRYILNKIKIIIEISIYRLNIARSKTINSKDVHGEINKNELKDLLKPKPVIIEIGAHNGSDTVQFASIFPQSTIYAFEPFPNNICRLIKNCQNFNNIIPVCAALSNRNGVSEFYQSSGGSDGSGSILTPTLHLEKHPTVFFKEEDRVTVVTITLDTFFNKDRNSSIDLIWMDVQGAEKIVLEGGTKVLKKTSYIYMEVSSEPLYEGALTYNDMKNFMSDLGFIVVQEFLPQEWQGDGNVLFKNSLIS
jgi:FkbM family methyltransferase